MGFAALNPSYKLGYESRGFGGCYFARYSLKLGVACPSKRGTLRGSARHKPVMRVAYLMDSMEHRDG
jgi:hypothetical protein